MTILRMSDNEMEVDLPPTQTNDEVMDAEPTKEVSFKIDFDTSNH